MKRTKKIIIALIVVLAVIAIVIYARGGGGEDVEYTTSQVERQDLDQTVSATGQMKSAEEIKLNFAASGRIIGVYTEVGEKVPAGKVLARLDASDLSVQLRQYQANLDSTKANLQNVLNGATDPELQVAQEEVNNAEVSYQASVTAFENSKKDRTENMNIYRETAINDMENYIFKARASLDKVKSAYDDPNGGNYISIRNPQYLVNTKVQREDALSLLLISEEAVARVKIATEQSQVLAALDNVKLSLDQTALTLGSMYQALLSSIASGSFTETSLETLKTNIKAEQTIISTGISTMQTDRSNLQTRELFYNNAVATAEDAVSIKKQAWDLAKARYDLTVADPKSSDVSYYQALVDQSSAQVASVRQRMSDRIIIAPVEGIVTKVENSVGEYASVAAPVVVMLGDQKFEIEVDVPESDIAKVSVGDAAMLTLDAFGDDIGFTGHIVLIEPAETEISGVVYYKVKVSLDETEKDVKPGMTANVDFLTDERKAVLVIPQRAVVDGIVRIIVNEESNEVKDREVITGLKGDGGLVEIISGLEEGEKVVTFVKSGKK